MSCCKDCNHPKLTVIPRNNCQIGNIFGKHYCIVQQQQPNAPRFIPFKNIITDNNTPGYIRWEPVVVVVTQPQPPSITISNSKPRFRNVYNQHRNQPQK